MSNRKNPAYVGMTVKEIEELHKNIAEAEQYEKNLRDEFAKAAITGILANSDYTEYCKHPEKTFSNLAYRVADAMLKRRIQDVDDESK